MRSSLSFGMGIISLQMSAVPPRLWDLAVDWHELLALKEEKKICMYARQNNLAKLYFSLCHDGGEELPQPRLKLSSAGRCVYVTLSSLERD